MFAKVKQLFTNLVIYGLGDVATTIISFFLLPIYVRYLSPDDYGVLSLLADDGGGDEDSVPVGHRRLVHAPVLRLRRPARAPGAREHTDLVPARHQRHAARDRTPWRASPRPSSVPHRRLHADAAARAHQHVRDRLLLRAVPRDADRRAAAAVHRPGILAVARDARAALAVRHRAALRRAGRRPRRHRGHGDLHARTGAMVRPLGPVRVLAAGLERIAPVWPSTSATRCRAPGHRGVRSLHPRPLCHAARARAVLDWRKLRTGDEVVSERVRIRVGAVLFRIDEGARRQGDVQPRHDVRDCASSRCSPLDCPQSRPISWRS